MNVFNNVLVLAPHADDGEFGCGGTIARLVTEQANINLAIFSIAVRSLPHDFPSDTLKNETGNASEKLGLSKSQTHIYDYSVRTFPSNRQSILEKLIELREKIKPDLVLLPSLNDIHQDHSTIAREGLRSFKRTTVLGYELPWNNLTFDHQVYISLEKDQVQAKIDALSCYESQKHRNYSNPDYIWSLATTRGIDVNLNYAEAFELYRWVIT